MDSLVDIFLENKFFKVSELYVMEIKNVHLKRLRWKAPTRNFVVS